MIVSVVNVGAESRCKYQPFKRQWLLYIPTGNIKKILLAAQKFNLCFLFGSQRRTFPYTTLSGFFLNRDEVGLLRGTKWISI
jgi:hypothetical protein